MDNYTVCQFEKDMRWSGFLLVRSAETRTDKKGTPYLDMNVCDRTGEINCKMWGREGNVPATGSVVFVQGLVQEFNGRLQFRLENFRPKAETDHVDMSRLVPCAPRSGEDMMKQVEDAIEGFHDEKLRRLVRKMLDMYDRDLLLSSPAAQRIHHAEQGGLLHHITDMLSLGETVIRVYKGLNADLLRAGIILHDLAKMDEMKSDALGNVSDYSMDGILVGHLVRGAMNLERAAKETGVSGETVTLLSHMLLSHHGELEYGSPKVPMTAEAEVLHWLDMMDARINTIQGVQKRLSPGTFSENIPSLERRVYCPMYSWDGDTETSAKN